MVNHTTKSDGLLSGKIVAEGQACWPARSAWRVCCPPFRSTRPRLRRRGNVQGTVAMPTRDACKPTSKCSETRLFPSVARKVLIPLHGRIGSVPLRTADPAIGYVLTGKGSTVHA